MAAWLSDARRRFHAACLAGPITETNGVPSVADVANRPSREIASAMVARIGAMTSHAAKPPGQTAGTMFETACQGFLAEALAQLAHLRPGEFRVERAQAIAQFAQYAHLEELRLLALGNRALRTHLGSDYLIKPDVVVTSDRADAATLAAAVPAGVRVVRLGGFGSMADTEAMLEDLALVSQSPEGGKVTRYRRGWFVLAKNSGARGERVLLLTACGDTPYSYGRRHVLGDLFFSAGFNVLEDDVAVRPLRAGEAFADLPALVAHHRPDIVFTFDRSTDDTCRAVLDPAGQRIIHLDGKNFLNPGPRLLDGLKELAAAMRHEATQ